MKWKKNKGFTLIELLVTIAIAAIIISIAFPAMGNFIKDKKLTSQVNAFVSGVRAARGVAIKRRGQIDLERRGGSWVNGWEIQDSTDAVIKQWDSNKGVTLGAASANILSFSSGGIRTTIVGDFTIKFCDSRGKGRLITIKGLGGVSSICWIGYGARAENCAPDPGGC